ncbi:phosphotransferase [Vibrio sp. ZSDZ34]|uniref:Phosphotransferase n=1 Tax=Vibrio gelatinilyticus TaxID=2893468 RepID=A0A9X1WEJ4_9VIBR|nr:phosphotransferase [Vibrio gelatinilyticus]MCJ2377960.1 phosphotransferase [Vibrio gelatinilyticus]
MNWSSATALDPTLKWLPSLLNEQPFRAAPLSGGLTNRCWRIEVQGSAPMLWRPSGKATQSFDLCRQHEAKVLQSVAGTLETNQFIAVNDKGLLVTWVEGDVINESLSQHQVLSVLSDIHRSLVCPEKTGSNLKKFDFTAKVDTYWHNLRDLPERDKYQLTYQRFRECSLKTISDAVLCHLDLGQYNLLRTTNGIAIIDWEYAAIADPRLDLALTLDNIQGDVETGVREYCQLRGITFTQEWLDGVKKWQQHSRLMAILWYLLAFQVWRVPEYLAIAEQIDATICRVDHCL